MAYADLTVSEKKAIQDVLNVIRPSVGEMRRVVNIWKQIGALNVAIRTFFIEHGRLHFGTGGGITYDSDPRREWEETELKARRLLAVASRDTTVEPYPSGRRTSR